MARAKARLPAETRALSEFFRILGDETRCKIVLALAGDELCVCEIADVVGSSVSNISHHLRLLKAARLVKYQKNQKRVFYSLDDRHVQELIAQGLEHMRHK